MIANGDITSRSGGVALAKKYNLDGVMIGRAALGRPWLIGEIAAGLEGRSISISTADRRDAALEHIDKLEAFCDRITGCHVVVAQPVGREGAADDGVDQRAGGSNERVPGALVAGEQCPQVDLVQVRHARVSFQPRPPCSVMGFVAKSGPAKVAAAFRRSR